MVIGFTGQPSAGKGTAAAYLGTKYKAVTYRFSTPPRDILNRLYQPVTRPTLQALATLLRAQFGNDIFAQTLLKDLEREQAALIVLDGIRHVDELRILRQRPDFVLVAIETPLEVRFERIQHRGENADDTTLTLEQFRKQHEHQTEQGIADLMQQADHTLKNTGTPEQLYAQLDALLEKLKV
jgi:dephospho-CoA kinase